MPRRSERTVGEALADRRALRVLSKPRTFPELVVGTGVAPS